MVSVLHDKQQAIVALCARFGVTRLDVFGSALRDDFRPGESDFDLLVEFAPMEPRDSPTPTSACCTSCASCSAARSTWSCRTP